MNNVYHEVIIMFYVDFWFYFNSCWMQTYIVLTSTDETKLRTNSIALTIITHHKDKKHKKKQEVRSF